MYPLFAAVLQWIKGKPPTSRLATSFELHDRVLFGSREYTVVMFGATGTQWEDYILLRPTRSNYSADWVWAKPGECTLLPPE